jgi:hypothetical protein
MATVFGPQPKPAPLTWAEKQWRTEAVGFEQLKVAPLGQGLFDKEGRSWLGPVSKGLTLASGIFEAAQLFKAGGSYRSQARQFERQARLALEQGFQTGIDIEREGQQIVGSMTAIFGKSGSLLEGSPLLALADMQSRVHENVERVVRQGRIEYAAYMRQARQLKRAAKSSKIAGVVKIGGSILGAIPGLNPVGASLATAGSI